MKPLGILWAQYGPYHFARAAALKELAGPARVHALEMANKTSDYHWNRSTKTMELTTLCPGAQTEKLTFRDIFHRARKTFAKLNLGVCILPSYAPKQSLAALLAARSMGIHTVMMNESHAGTARARGLTALLKRRLVGMFDAALVGGQPQKRYFASLGIPEDRIFPGYDAVDNNSFRTRANEIRRNATMLRNRYDLPEHYFLNLGRFVAKKNLETLINAYRQYLDTSPLKQAHLVMVGSGEEETRLKWLCHRLALRVYEKSAVGVRSGKEAGEKTENGGQGTEIENRKSQIENGKPGVHFYGFRQIEESPVFYSLADAFVLPSLYEEWGLVVNEAMASGLPVIVSDTAGCAEDLLETGLPIEDISLDANQLMIGTALDARIRQNGFVFDPRSSDELGRILVLVDSCPNLRAVMGQNSRRIVEKFSCENFAKNALLAAQAALDTKAPAARKKRNPTGEAFSR